MRSATPTRPLRRAWWIWSSKTTAKETAVGRRATQVIFSNKELQPITTRPWLLPPITWWLAPQLCYCHRSGRIFFLDEVPQLSRFQGWNCACANSIAQQRYIRSNSFATEDYWKICRWVFAQSVQKFLHCTTIILFLWYSYSQIKCF